MLATDREKKIKIMQKVKKTHRYLAGFEVVLKLISVTSTNSWTDHTMKDCHLHNNFHTFKGYDIN